MNLQEQMVQNLFSANHRNAMIQKYGYTQAMTITVDELNFQFGRPEAV